MSVDSFLESGKAAVNCFLFSWFSFGIYSAKKYQWFTGLQFENYHETI